MFGCARLFSFPKMPRVFFLAIQLRLLKNNNKKTAKVSTCIAQLVLMQINECASRFRNYSVKHSLTQTPIDIAT